ncbi:NADH-quinone oxidoreductase subunit L [Flammeovirga pectinis]|uniref:NADH-quinone oxidoreductase subunit L n=1 Tax=Flammeovirga pectinis TaxID=2494373 RepID=A0A3Q9FKQ5_9BACT|nr:NADH-quinone oxidoreductase subunit L [Flammeovirga pectinis]
MNYLNFLQIIISIAVCSPLLGALILSLRKSNQAADKIASLMIGISAICSIVIFALVWSGQNVFISKEWFFLGDNYFYAILSIDKLSALLLSMVSIVSLLVHVYSSAYMQGDPQYKRYFTLLNIFTFSMYGVLLSDNLVLIYLFWELVGFCSYMLIGFWREKEAAVKAAKKAFIVNRVGDAGFMVALLCLYAQFGTLSLHAIIEQFDISMLSNTTILIAAIGVTLAAMGKSAQIPFSVWLPDAMQGPTPVSALIHAATMVAAGIYLLVRCFFFLPEDVLMFIAGVGGLTAFIGAFSALSQYDIKRILAYSTISQLGYMMLAIGVGDPESAIFHLTTHAFFKAGLFLGAGALIHSMHQVSCDICKGFDPQDIRWMGGLRKYMPKTFIGFSIALAALIGLPFTSGFLSKDALLSSVLLKATNDGIYWQLLAFLGFGAAALTAFYSIRVLYKVFFGELGIAQHKVCQKCLVLPHEVGNRMYLPILLLGSLSVWFFYVLSPFNTSESWIQTSLSIPTLDHHSVHIITIVLSISMICLGGGLAYLIYFKGRLLNFKKSFKQGFLFKVSYNFFYIQNLYRNSVLSVLFVARSLDGIPHADEGFVKVAIGTSEFVRGFDDKVIDFFVKLFAVFNVVLGHVLAWFDKYIVDGIVLYFTKFLWLLGDLFRKPQGERTQSMIAWSLFLLLSLFTILWF